MFMGSARSESMGETHMFRRLVGLAAAAESVNLYEALICTYY